jgi:DNA (cytosine-5)-methyltransferase 1
MTNSQLDMFSAYSAYKPNSVESINFIDLFAGIGGFRQAFEAADFKCVFSSEINEHCQKVYENNFKEAPFPDVAKIDAEKLPTFEILLAGFPCQPFSICGKKKGFEDTRGTLFFDICRIIDIKRPSVVVLENVKHLIHHDSGNTLSTILSTLESLEYTVSYKLLNSKDFGVPQNRERIVIIAHKGGIKFNFSKLKTQPMVKLKDFLDVEGEFEYLNPNEYTILDNHTVQKTGLIFIGYRNKNIWKKGIRPNTEHLSRVHRQPNRIYSVEGTHPTLPSQESSGRFFIYLPDEDKVRKLTINECYRIMGFSENFQRAASLSEQYKQIGNSVCVPMMKEIALQIKEQGLIND